MPELLAVCDRIYVLCDGRLTGDFERESFDPEAIMEAATRFIDDDRDPAVRLGDAGSEPMSTRTAERGMPSQASARLSLVDIVCLVSTVALLVSFVVLPWVIDAGTSVTGLSLLLSESPPLTPEVGIVLSEIRWALLLVPLATVMAGVGLFLKLTGRAERRWAIWLLPLAGLVGFAYFAMYLVHDRQTPLMLMQYTGVGFWVACFASGILFLQHFAAQSSASAHAAPAHAGLTQRLRRSVGKLLDGPRANQMFGSVFRFQSLFGLFIVIVLAIAISPAATTRSCS